MTHVTKRATSGAFVTHDHKGCCALTKAFADVRARGLFANGVKIVFTQNPLDLVKARSRGCCLHAYPIGFF